MCVFKLAGRNAGFLFFALCAGLATLVGCTRAPDTTPRETASASSNADAAGFTAPTAATVAANRTATVSLPQVDADFANAARGFIAKPDALTVAGPGGETLWDMPAYAFLDGEVTDGGSVHPSLRRQARLNNQHGLYEVRAGIYQLRGFDLSNMTIVVGERGWIVIDPLTSRETASAALAFARQHLAPRPVTAVIFTHSHADHFAGVLGVVSAAEVAARNIPVVAPAGFLEEALSENVAAGVAMGRRATYMYGRGLPRGPRGHVDSGLGKSPAFGSFGILEPNDYIERTGEERVLDGVRFIFQNAPGSEAPSELTFFLPDLKAYCGAEIVSHTMHNLYTLRGAKVRDALAWSGYIDEARQMFSAAEVIFNSHHWPIWGNVEVLAFLEDQRDLYKFMHDQTLRLANSGLTPREIAETLTLPEALQRRFANRGYYGTLRHNSKAVYQYYLGWYDANPAQLDPLPPADAAPRYVAAMGGAAAVVEKARDAFATGDYRWASSLLDHLVFAEPDNTAARELLAATYDQLGYQAESAPWRDVYLTGAYELRHGVSGFPSMLQSAADMLAEMPLENFLISMATRLDPDKAGADEFRIGLHFVDLGKSYLLEVRNAVMHHRALDETADVDATLEVTHAAYLGLVSGRIGVVRGLAGDEMSVSGSKLKLARFFSLFDQPDGNFPIVTP